MMRTGLVRASSMMPFCTPNRDIFVDHSQAPWVTHWTRTCEHDLVARIKKYPHGPRAKMQCKKCGIGVGANVAMKGVFELWDSAAEDRATEEYNAALEEYKKANEAAIAHQRGERSRDWWQAYNAYLKSPNWHRKRQLVMKRCGGICESCGELAADHVHHLVYPETFGEEPLWELRGVCVPCHKIIHPHMD